MHERPLVFATFGEVKALEKLQDIVKFLGGKPVSQAFTYLERYHKGFRDCNVFDAILKMLA